MTLLALDPATNCGWAYRRNVSLVSGTWDLSVRRDESSGMRLIRLQSKLDELVTPKLVVYEAARHAAPKMQGALVIQATLQGVIQMWCEGKNVEYRGYSPSEIKKHATGKGNANKADMIEAAWSKWKKVVDDNEADALWLLDLAMTQYGDVL